MNQGHLAYPVGVGIRIRYTAVGRPSGMSDSTGKMIRTGGNAAQILYTSLTFVYLRLRLMLSANCQSGTIVSSVLQKLQTV